MPTIEIMDQTHFLRCKKVIVILDYMTIVGVAKVIKLKGLTLACYALCPYYW
jgi:hypothetical protein